jgi:murein DD-endopeptidase
MGLILVVSLVACATPTALPRVDRGRIVTAALAQVGAPYRYGGTSPTGFDCSGLVVYSFSYAGLSGLPHSASALEERARSVEIGAVRPGDLLFFRLGGLKTRHVAIVTGPRSFVHAPSSGNSVERVDFDHPYWGKLIRRAGRLVE